MRPVTRIALRAASLAVLLGLLLPTVLAHGDDESATAGMSMEMGENQDMEMDTKKPAAEIVYPPSYFSHQEHRATLLAHIGFMVAAWLVILPLSTMFSLARSRYTVPMQFVFTAVNALGLLFGKIYDANTPDLYPNNAHSKLGWFATSVLSTQIAVSLLGRVVGAFGKPEDGENRLNAAECRSFIPVSHAALDEHQHFQNSQYSSLCRHSDDSGHGTDRSASFSSIPDTLASPTAENAHHKEFAEEDEDLEADLAATPRGGVLHRLAVKVGNKISSKFWKVLIFGYNFVDRTSMILGFIALCTGIVTMGRFFEGRQIFTGLAHWIKGGVFFWLGVLTLGRWAGCFGDLGWAWNIRPKSASGRWVPSAEFVESFLIFFYGSTNIFLEHLGNWGGSYSFEDLEHISITVLFLGGGLCGMLIESVRIRDLLNTTVTQAINEGYDNVREHELALEEPGAYRFSMNPIPALVILLLGIMMSSHTQESMISSMVHKQWGTMLVGASFARGFTYIITYLKPPTTVMPSRPPTEVLAAFGLMTGGILFMASSGDTVAGMIHYNLDVMFMYTITMGLVALLMAWEIIVLAVKGWATRMEAGQKTSSGRYYGNA
ncbi:hypothetical protein BD289DRAFT_365417 [Coniella lustricola]|uniref:Integral membrane protein n=1 Tax=Coniella lustricola TaxID=2025994 RepID=A0A2T3ACC9_9PEZI|nr:hypothetical protein BD289DRAFT_365417 [Coniella lustricola]